MRKATYRQLMFLYLQTDKCLELRNMGLSFDDASDLVSKIKNKEISIEQAKEQLLELGAEEKQNKETTAKKDWDAIYNLAHKAGVEAANNCKPKPMLVVEHTNPMDDNSPVKNAWEVSGGVCGFASIRFPINTGFGKWAVKNKLADKAHYGSGGYIWIGQFGQSYEKKTAYAYAFAKSLKENGVERCYVESRLD